MWVGCKGKKILLTDFCSQGVGASLLAKRPVRETYPYHPPPHPNASKAKKFMFLARNTLKASNTPSRSNRPVHPTDPQAGELHHAELGRIR